MEESKKEYSSEEDVTIATLILRFSSELGFNDPSKLTLRERERKYYPQFERIRRIFNEGKDMRYKRTFSSFCNRINMIVRELRILKAPENRYKDKGSHSKLYTILEEILLKSPNLGVPSETDIDANDISAKTPVIVVDDKKSDISPVPNSKPIVTKMIRNDVFAHGSNSKNKTREEKKRQTDTPTENAPSMKRINLTAKLSSNTYPIEVDLFNTRKSIATNSITKMIHTEDTKDNYPLLDESSSLDSTLSDDNMGGLESMPHVIEMQNENRKQKESGLTDSERVDLELEKREKKKKEKAKRRRHKRGEIIDESFSSSDFENNSMDDVIFIDENEITQTLAQVTKAKPRNARSSKATKTTQASQSVESSRKQSTDQTKSSSPLSPNKKEKKDTSKSNEDQDQDSKPSLKASPDRPSIQPVLKASPEHPSIQPVLKASPEHPTIQPVLEASSVHPSIQPVLEASPDRPSIQPVLEASPEHPSIQPVLEASPEHPSVQPVLEASPDHPTIQPVLEASPEQSTDKTSSNQQVIQPILEASPNESETQPVLKSSPTDSETKFIIPASPTDSENEPILKSLSSQQQQQQQPNEEEKVPEQTQPIEEKRDALESSLCADLDTSYSVPVSGPVTPVQNQNNQGNSIATATRAIPPSGLSNIPLSDQYLTQPLPYNVNFQSPIYPVILPTSSNMMPMLPTQKQTFMSMPVQNFPNTEDLPTPSSQKETISNQPSHIQSNEPYSSPKPSNPIPVASSSTTPTVTATLNQPFVTTTPNPPSIALPTVPLQSVNETGNTEEPEKEIIHSEEGKEKEKEIPSQENTPSQQVPLNGPCYCSSILMCNCNVEIKAVYSSYKPEERSEENILSSILQEVQYLREEIKRGGYTKEQANEIEKKVDQIVDSVNEVYHSNLNPM